MTLIEPTGPPEVLLVGHTFHHGAPVMWRVKTRRPADHGAGGPCVHITPGSAYEWLSGSPDNAHWIELLGEDPRILFRTAAAAQRAVDHLDTLATATTGTDEAAA